MRARVCSFLGNFPILGLCPVSCLLVPCHIPPPPPHAASSSNYFSLAGLESPAILPPPPPPSIVWTCEMSAKSRPKLLARFVGRLRFQTTASRNPVPFRPLSVLPQSQSRYPFRSCGILSPGRDAAAPVGQTSKTKTISRRRQLFLVSTNPNDFSRNILTEGPLHFIKN